MSTRKTSIPTNTNLNPHASVPVLSHQISATLNSTLERLGLLGERAKGDSRSLLRDSVLHSSHTCSSSRMSDRLPLDPQDPMQQRNQAQLQQLLATVNGQHHQQQLQEAMARRNLMASVNNTFDLGWHQVRRHPGAQSQHDSLLSSTLGHLQHASATNSFSNLLHARARRELIAQAQASINEQQQQLGMRPILSYNRPSLDLAALNEARFANLAHLWHLPPPPSRQLLGAVAPPVAALSAPIVLGKRTGNGELVRGPSDPPAIVAGDAPQGVQQVSRGARMDTAAAVPSSSSPCPEVSAPKAPPSKKPSKPPAKKRRVALDKTGVYSGEPIIPPHTERERHPLGVDEDHNWLSEFQCFARLEMMEVFQASKEDVVVRSTSKSVKLNQVGVRCRFCAHVPHADRVNRSSAFPSGLAKIYQSFNMMVRDHFANCKEIDPSILTEYLALKGKNSQGACDSRHYWFYAAKKLGMVDTDSGIEMTPESKLAAESLPPYGTAEALEGETASVAATEANDPSGSLTGTKQEEDLSLFPRNEVEGWRQLPGASPFWKELMSHLQIVRLLQSERVGKRKTLPIGLEGFGCRYCYQVGRLGFSRCYPLRRRGLSAQIYDMNQHLQRCTVCPKEVKLRLKELEPSAAKMAAAKKPTKASAATTSEREDAEVLDMVWTRLGRTSDLTT